MPESTPTPVTNSVTQPEQTTPAEPERATAEQWHARKLATLTGAYEPKRLHAEAYFAGAKIKHGWVEGEMMTQAEFDAGIKSTAEHVCK